MQTGVKIILTIIIFIGMISLGLFCFLTGRFYKEVLITEIVILPLWSILLTSMIKDLKRGEEK